ncbi:MAG TPA: TorF family putative porin [Pseudomonadales bacterium]|jgi:uncharacterized protein (TIGR02001 family)
MKTFAKTLMASSLLLAATGATAEDIGSGWDLSANVTLASEYLWRGISQTQGKGAIQGGVDLTHESGFYLGTWASNVDFDSEASSEWDFYTGYSFDVGPEDNPITLDVGLLEYTYTEQNSLNFLEAYTSVGMAGFTLGYNYQIESQSNANIAGSPSSSETFDYVYLTYDMELPGEIGMNFIVAQYDFKDAVFFDGPFDVNGKDKYTHYGITASKTLLGMDMALTYSSTDLSDDECKSFSGNSNYCNEVVVLSASKSF